jgi:glucosylceramidase
MRAAASLLALALVVAVASPSIVWQTSRDGDRLAALGAFAWLDAPPAGAATMLQADFTSVRQTITGFGGAITESAAYNFAQLTPGNKSAAAASLFGAPSAGGNGLTMARVAINSPDFALSDYSYANTTGDYALKSFDHTLARDGMYVVPMIHAASAAAAPVPIKFFATPWSPPAWMKVPFGGDVPRMDGSTLPGLEGACNASWALYFSFWFSAMKRQYNVSFWGFTAQNEPTAVNVTGVAWDACGYTAPGMVDFLTRFLGPVMQRDHPDVRLMIFDHNNDHVEEVCCSLYRAHKKPPRELARACR